MREHLYTCTLFTKPVLLQDAHLTHEEIVQCMKWKLAMGKYSAKLKDLIQMNTPRVVMNDTKKAFRALEKRGDLEAAISALCTMKGVSPAFASAVLVAFRPEKVFGFPNCHFIFLFTLLSVLGSLHV